MTKSEISEQHSPSNMMSRISHEDSTLFPCLKFNNLARLTNQSTIIMLIREMRPFGEKPALGMFHSSSRPAARLQGSKWKGHMNPEHWRLVWGLHHLTTHSPLPIHIPSPGLRGHRCFPSSTVFIHMLQSFVAAN